MPFRNKDRGLKEAQSVVIKNDRMDVLSDPSPQAEFKDDEVEYRNDKNKMDFKTFLNNETLAPSNNITRQIQTPSNRGRSKAKFRKILRKAHKMRFQLIQKLKDGKILFEIIDEYYKKRAEQNAVLAIKLKHISQYKIKKMYEIFEPQPADLLSDIGSPRTMEEFEFLTPRSNNSR